MPISQVTENSRKSNGRKSIYVDFSLYRLSLQMVTKWAKLNNDLEEIYQYDDEKTTELLHRAQTDPKSPRLICVLQQNDQPNWDTFCLSDFIRTRKFNH